MAEKELTNAITSKQRKGEKRLEKVFVGKRKGLRRRSAHSSAKKRGEQVVFGAGVQETAGNKLKNKQKPSPCPKPGEHSGQQKTRRLESTVPGGRERKFLVQRQKATNKDDVFFLFRGSCQGVNGSARRGTSRRGDKEGGGEGPRKK